MAEDATAARSLPRGRHDLTRDQVVDDQRLRILVGMADAMGELGYVATSVAEVIRRAGVSRQTFYALYDDKLDAFLAAYDLVAEVVLDHMRAALDADTDVTSESEPIERFERAADAYLDLLARELGYARLFLVEVHAAGPRALARRAAAQASIAAALADLLGVTDERGRFAADVVVAAVSAMITMPILERDPDGLRRLGPPVVDHVRRLVEAGLLGSGT